MYATERRARPYEILITDDDEGCRESLRDALATEGYGTELASTGHEAIELVRRKLVHVVIVDMNMPDLTGLETVTIIRREAPVPSILMSADHSRHLMQRALMAHCESFMPKPLNLAVLRHIIEEIIRRHYESDL